MEEGRRLTGGKPFISLRWVDTNKGSEESPNIRSRLVARELKCRTPQLTAAELFSAMPPAEGAKALASIMVNKRVSKRGLPLKMAFFDIKRAHFYGVARRTVVIELPAERAEEGKCGVLLRTMYGTRDASQAWQAHYGEVLTTHGFQQGIASAASFRSEDEDISLQCHGDDFQVVADDIGLQFFEELLVKNYDFTTTARLGFGSNDDRRAHYLGREFRLKGNEAEPCIEIESDTKHVDESIRLLGLSGARAVVSPSVKSTAEEAQREQGLPPLPPDQATMFRSILMRLAYAAQDRPDLVDALKPLTRKMSSPTEADYTRLKRVGRYLLGNRRAWLVFKSERMPPFVYVEADSDFAGDLVTRKSTTGVCVMLGSHCLRTAGNLQSTVSLSSGEAENYAAVQGAAAGLGMAALFADWGIQLKVVLGTDSSAARGLSSRRGIGKVRHIETRFLWLQERVASRAVQIWKIAGEKNRADALTKALTGDRLRELCNAMGLVFESS